MTGQAPVARRQGTGHTARLRLRGGHRLIVSGEDQLFTFADTLEIHVAGAPSGADGYLESPAVGVGEVWCLTNVVVEDEDTDLTSIRACRCSGGVCYCFGCTTKAIPKTDRICWHGVEYAAPGDTIRATLIGSQAADTCHMWITGYKMTLET